jgi:hypothetical protein
MRDYWLRQEQNDLVKGALAETEAALAVDFPLDDTRLGEYLTRLEGPEGCDFTRAAGSDPDDITWTCGGGTDKSKSHAILKAMGLDSSDIFRVHLVVDALGGHCDCEILFNAASRMVPENGGGDE